MTALLLDQNLSYRLLLKILTHFPGSQQVRLAGLENATDLAIWDFAKRNELTILPFDADFIEIANLKGHPPKVIWLRTGNRSTIELEITCQQKRCHTKLYFRS